MPIRADPGNNMARINFVSPDNIRGVDDFRHLSCANDSVFPNTVFE
jgi:hypothetical protein